MVTKEQVAEFIQKNFPNCPICRSDAGYEVSGAFKNYVQCKSCLAKWMSNDFQGCKELRKLRLAEAAKNGKGSELLKQEHPIGFWQTLEVKDGVNWELMPKPNPEISGVLFLEAGEEILAFWDGDREIWFTAVEKRRAVKAKETEYGSMVLTNRRLFWVAKRGVFGKSYHSTCEIRLEDIKGISSGGALLKYISIMDSQGENIFHLRIPGIPGSVDSARFSPPIQSAIKARKEELESEKKRERVHVLLDFSFLKDHMRQGGLSIETFRCPSCGAPVKLPDSGNQTTCEHCGSVIYSQDIFEKIKALIG